MPEELVAVGTYATPLEADLAKNYLEAEGVPTFLSDDATVGWFWHLGNAVGGIKLMVPRDQAERAAAILASRPGRGQDVVAEAGLESESSGGEMATCPRCAAPLSPDMDYCPTCGAELDKAESAALVPAIGNGTAGGAEDQGLSEVSPGDDLANRALRAAVLGLLILPPLLHFYSAWLLARLAFYSGKVSDRGMRRMMAASVLDAVVFLFACLLWSFLFH